MYNGLLHAHNGLRWIVLISLLLAVFLGIYGWIGKKEWKNLDGKTGLFLVIFMDLQFLLGLILYTFLSPVTRLAFKDFGAAMKNADLRFYAVEHIAMMLIALVLVHIGRAKTKKDVAGWKRHRNAVIFFGISLVFILAAIPWERAFF